MAEENSRNGHARRRRPRRFREPSSRWWWALGSVLSVGVIYHGLTAEAPAARNPTVFTLRFLCLGVGGLSISAAGFLPETPLATRLRIFGYALLWLFAGLLLVEAGLEAMTGGE